MNLMNKKKSRRKINKKNYRLNYNLYKLVRQPLKVFSRKGKIKMKKLQ